MLRRKPSRPASQADAAENDPRALEERAAMCARTAAIYHAAHQVLLEEARRLRARTPGEAEELREQ
jgi:hypothetical protein